MNMGENLSLLAGASYAHGKNRTSDNTDIYGLDVTVTRQWGDDSTLVWQSEYVERTKKVESVSNKQAGLYTQLVYQYDNYSVGMRYDVITKNDTDLSAYSGVDTENLERYTAMLEYKPLSMARVRLSYAYDKTKVIDMQRKDIHEVMLTLNIAVGEHDGHSD